MDGVGEEPDSEQRLSDVEDHMAAHDEADAAFAEGMDERLVDRDATESARMGSMEDRLDDRERWADASLEALTRKPHLNDRILFGWTRWVWLILALLLNMIALVVGLWRFERFVNEYREEGRSDSYANCAELTDGRQRIINLLDDLTDNPDALAAARTRLPLLDCEPILDGDPAVVLLDSDGDGVPNLGVPSTNGD